MDTSLATTSPLVEVPPTKTKIEKALDKLTPQLNLAAYEEKAAELVVTDESQTELMAQAKAARLELRTERLRLEELRKVLKAEAQAEITAIDGKAREDRRRIEALEAHFQEQEDYAHHQQQFRLTNRLLDRKARLAPYNPDVDSVYGLRDMEDDVFEKLLADAMVAHENALEVQRLAKVEEEAKEAELRRLQLENDRLQEKQQEAARLAVEERLKREALEQEQADALKRQELEQQAEADRKRAAETAPDRAKLLDFIAALRHMERPSLTTLQARTYMDLFIDELDSALATLEVRAKNLASDEAPF